MSKITTKCCKHDGNGQKWLEYSRGREHRWSDSGSDFSQRFECESSCEKNLIT